MIKPFSPLEKTEIITLDKLAEYAQVILLVNTDQYNILRKYTRFRVMPMQRLQPLTTLNLVEMLEKRLYGIKLPIGKTGLMLIAYLSKNLPGEFLRNVRNIYDFILMNKVQNELSAEDVIQILGYGMDDECIVLACLPDFLGKSFTPSELAKVIKGRFGVRLSPEIIGRTLTGFQLPSRRVQDRREYILPRSISKTFPSKLSGILPELTSGGYDGSDG